MNAGGGTSTATGNADTITGGGGGGAVITPNGNGDVTGTLAGTQCRNQDFGFTKAQPSIGQRGDQPWSGTHVKAADIVAFTVSHRAGSKRHQQSTV